MTKVTALANNGNAMVEIGPIDPSMLKDQIELLIDSIIDDPDNALWGIVYMLEDIADEIQMEKMRHEPLQVERPIQPPISELIGILGPDWTGGVDSVEWIRQQRD